MFSGQLTLSNTDASGATLSGTSVYSNGVSINIPAGTVLLGEKSTKGTLVGKGGV